MWLGGWGVCLAHTAYVVSVACYVVRDATYAVGPRPLAGLSARPESMAPPAVAEAGKADHTEDQL